MPYTQILELATLPTLQNVYQIGCYARRVTLYSQQARAVNLIDAIHNLRTPLKDKSIAIVGGGAAGVTAAARAISFGATVTLIEKAPKVVSIQSGSRHRWLHPSLYDWPFAAVRPEEEMADLPIMKWLAGNANEVAASLQEQFEKINEKLTFIRNSQVTRIENDDQKLVRVFWKNEVKPFHLAILAVGFGLEPFNSVQNSYWEGDPIDNTSRGNSSVLVVGYGDGALTDVMRACILDFDHKRELTEIIRLAARDGRLDLIRSIEKHPRAAEDAFLTERYTDVDVPSVRLYLERIRNKTRKVVLAGPGPHLFSSRASALNRMILAQLKKLNAFHHVAFDATSKIHGNDKNDPVLMEILGRAQSEIQEVPQHILLRFGPVPVINQIEGIADGLRSLEDRWKAVEVSDDSTRDRLWESPFASVPDFTKSFLVFGHKNSAGKLAKVARAALEGTGLEANQILSRETSQCCRNRAALLHTVQALCHAPAALFAIGEEMGLYNSVGMLLLGIRAAVRRGVTLLVHDQEIGTKEWNQMPFNLRELPIFSVPLLAEAADDLSNALRSAGDILRGDSSGYRDLPVFDIVRRAGRRTPVLPESEVELFTLCSFSKSYSENLWETLNLLFRGQTHENGKLVLKRVIDYSSPLLVAERLYELIRFAGQCVVDWSEWRPNVFFELGVRLAVNPILPISIIQEGDLQNLDSADPGRRQLVEIFRPIPYPVEDEEERRANFIEVFKAELDTRMRVSTRTQTVYATAWRNARLDQERGGIPLSEILFGEAQRLVRDIGRTGRIPVLYGENQKVGRQAQEAVVEMLWAAYTLAKDMAPPMEAAALERIRSLLEDLLDHTESPRFLTIQDKLRED